MSMTKVRGTSPWYKGATCCDMGGPHRLWSHSIEWQQSPTEIPHNRSVSDIPSARRIQAMPRTWQKLPTDWRKLPTEKPHNADFESHHENPHNLTYEPGETPAPRPLFLGS